MFFFLQLNNFNELDQLSKGTLHEFTFMCCNCKHSFIIFKK